MALIKRKKNHDETSSVSQPDNQNFDSEKRVETKIHESPPYAILTVEKICQVFIVLAIAILAYDKITYRHPEEKSNNLYEASLDDDSGQREFHEEYGQRPIEGVESKVVLINMFPSSKSISFTLPPPNEDGGDEKIDYFDFENLYKQYPLDASNDHNRTEEWPLDMDGHVFSGDDFNDDFLVDADQYLVEFFAFDDDLVSGGSEKCRRNSFHQNHNPTCNKVHEASLLATLTDSNFGQYLAHGAYRDAFSIRDGVVLKEALYEQDYDIDLMEMIRFDAVIMDALTSSDRIVSIYSHCSLSVHVEFIQGLDIEKLLFQDKENIIEDELYDLTPTKKLKMALEMAEALADLHGYVDGAIAHNDVQYGQFLLDRNNRAILSDFNRAEPLWWNAEKEDYCMYELGLASGNLRSPEEYGSENVNEKIDVYSFGNVIYSLLTGKEPWYAEGLDVHHLKDASYEIGLVPVVSAEIRGQSYANSVLSSIMDKCYEYYAEKRIDMFTIVSLLNDAIAMNDKFEAIEVTKFEIKKTFADYKEVYYENETVADDSESGDEDETNFWESHNNKEEGENINTDVESENENENINVDLEYEDVSTDLDRGDTQYYEEEHGDVYDEDENTQTYEESEEDEDISNNLESEDRDDTQYYEEEHSDAYDEDENTQTYEESEDEGGHDEI